MKIKLIIPYHQNLYDTILALKKKNEVEIITPERVRDIPKEIPHTIIKGKMISKKIGVLLSPTALWKTITRDLDYVIIKHINWPPNFLVYLICKIKGIKLIINIQKLKIPKTFIYYKLFRILTLFIGSKAKVFSVTKEGQIKAIRFFKKVSYIPACINPKRFKKKNYSKTNKNELNLICVSKYMRRKNIHLLILALKELTKKYPKTKFNLSVVGRMLTKGKIGKHHFAEMNVYSSILNLIKENKLNKNIKLIEDIPNTKMNNQYNKADVFVFPASSEPLGYALVEAMACGLPILCSDEVGAKSYIKEGKNGYIFKTKNVNVLVSSIEKFIKNGKADKEKMKSFGKISRKIIEKEHSPNSFLSKFNKTL